MSKDEKINIDKPWFQVCIGQPMAPKNIHNDEKIRTLKLKLYLIVSK